MMEVIARRKEGLLALYIAVAVVFIPLFFGPYMMMHFVDSLDGNPWFYAMLFLGVVCVGIFIWVIVGIIRTPRVAIAYENGKLYFGNGFSCTPQEITSVNYRRSHARGISYRWGRITVTLQGQTIKYDYIADVEYAHDRILQLMLEAKKKEG